MATGGGNPAPKQDLGLRQFELSALDIAVAVVGLVLIGILAGVVIWFYGTGGETSAAGVLGLTFTAIGSIVGTVFGVSAGTKSGAAGGIAGGQQVAEATTRSTTQAMGTTIDSLTKMAAHMDANLIPPPGRVHGLDAKHVTDLQLLRKQVGDALLEAQMALKVISPGS